MCWDKDVQESLQDFPNSFNLVHLQDLESRKQRYEAAIQNCSLERFESTFEKVRNENFLTLLLYKLGREKEALQRNVEVLKIDPENIVSLGNKVYLNSYFGDDIEASHTLEVLLEMKTRPDFDALISKAKGEIAYSYTRIGPRYYLKAIELFTSVIQCCPHKYLLKFGLALTYRRCLQQCIFTKEPLKDVGQAASRAVELLYDIIKNHNDDALKGKSYCLLGELFQIIDDCEFPITPDIVKNLHIERSIGIRECYVKGCEAGSSDWFVLARTGKYFRKRKEYPMAEDILLKAVVTHSKSTYAFYHLALVYKDMSFCEEQPRSKSYLTLAKKHLLTSIELSNGSNTRAVFELGLVLKASGITSEAENQFRRLIERGQPFASPLEKANAYEQLGLLYQERATSCEDSNKQPLLQKCKMMLTKSIEEAAKAVAGAPGMKTPKFMESCRALPTLQELLCSEREDNVRIGGLKEVGRLLTLMRKYKSSLDIFFELPAPFFDIGVMECTITNYIHLEDFDKALLVLNILRSTKDQQIGMRHREFVTSVFLDCALYFLSHDRLDDAKECFRNCFTSAYPSGPGSERMYDIFILDDDEHPSVSPLQGVLQQCGLNVTRNEQSSSPGPRHFKQDEVMLDSKTFLIIINDNNISNELQLFCGVALQIWSEQNDGRNIVVLTRRNVSVPRILSDFRRFNSDCDEVNIENTILLRRLFNLLLRLEANA